MKHRTTEEQYEYMTGSSIPPLIAKLAIPTIVSMLITSVYNMADTFFVSKLGTSATGAVGIFFSIMTIIQAVGFTLGNGAGAYISRKLGQKKVEEANKALSTAFFTAFAVGLLICAGGLLFLDPLIRALGATDTIFPFARDYAKYIFLGAPFMCTSFVMNNSLRAEGSALLSMVGIGTGGVLNMFLDPLFIFTFDMGIAGAAIATIISQFISFSIMLSQFLRKRSHASLHYKYFTFTLAMYKEIFRTGFPTFCRQGLASVANIIMNIAAASFGDAAIAAMSVVQRVFMFIMSASMGFAQGFQPFAGYNYGAGFYNRVVKGFTFCIKVIVTATCAIGVLGFISAPNIIAIFRKEDAEVIAIGALAFRMQCLILPLQGTTIVSNMLFQSLGRAKEAMVFSLSRQGLFFIPLILILPRTIGLFGVQSAQAIADALAFIALLPVTIRFVRQLKQKEQIDGKESEVSCLKKTKEAN